MSWPLSCSAPASTALPCWRCSCPPSATSTSRWAGPMRSRVECRSPPAPPPREPPAMTHRFLLLSTVVFLSALTFPGAGPAAADEDELERELPRIKPLEPDAALRSFRVHPGFRLEPVAVEPLV